MAQFSMNAFGRRWGLVSVAVASLALPGCAQERRVQPQPLGAGPTQSVASLSAAQAPSSQEPVPQPVAWATLVGNSPVAVVTPSQWAAQPEVQQQSPTVQADPELAEAPQVPVAAVTYSVSYVMLAPLPIVESATGHSAIVLSKHGETEQHVAVDFGAVNFSNSLLEGGRATDAIVRILSSQAPTHATFHAYAGPIGSYFETLRRDFQVTPFPITEDAARDLVTRVIAHFSVPGDQDFFSQATLDALPVEARTYNYHPYLRNCVTGIVDLLLEDTGAQDAWEPIRQRWLARANQPAQVDLTQRRVIEQAIDRTSTRLGGFSMASPARWQAFQTTGPEELRSLLILAGVPATGHFDNVHQFTTSLDLIRLSLRDLSDPQMGDPEQYGALSNAFTSYFFDPAYDRTGLTVRQTLIVPERIQEFVRDAANY